LAGVVYLGSLSGEVRRRYLRAERSLKIHEYFQGQQRPIIRIGASHAFRSEECYR